MGKTQWWSLTEGLNLFNNEPSINNNNPNNDEPSIQKSLTAVLDSIINIDCININWEKYYKILYWDKIWYVKKNEEAEKKCIFENVRGIVNVDWWEVYYEAQIRDKDWQYVWLYVKYGEEKQLKNYLELEKRQYDFVTGIVKVNGKIYYKALKWLKRWYVELWKEEIAIINYEYSKMWELKVDKEWVYFEYNWEKIYIDKN